MKHKNIQVVVVGTYLKNREDFFKYLNDHNRYHWPIRLHWNSPLMVDNSALAIYGRY